MRKLAYLWTVRDGSGLGLSRPSIWRDAFGNVESRKARLTALDATLVVLIAPINLVICFHEWRIAKKQRYFTHSPSLFLSIRHLMLSLIHI